MSPAVALVGPTGTGKSDLAHEVALELGDVEIVSVDSMTVYRRMDIATAKPTAERRAEVTYHLVDVAEPSEEFAVARFAQLAEAAAREATRRGRRVIYVGGTGLYVRAVVDHLDVPGQYPEVRAGLEARALEDLASLYAGLRALDPVAAGRMESTNARRVVRALEVTLGSGRPFSSYGPGLTAYGTGTVAQIALDVEPSELATRLADRFEGWMEDGLLDEVRALRDEPLGLSRTARQAVGYRQLLEHLEQGRDLDDAVGASIAATRRLARRQRSWFGRDPRVEWQGDRARARRRIIELLDGAAA